MTPKEERPKNLAQALRTVDALVPLFVTPHSLSSKSAIGTQTRAIMKEVGNGKHLYWDEVESRSFGKHSIRIESWPFGRISIFKRSSPSRLIRALGACGLSWWKDDELKPRRARALNRALHLRTSAVYVAISEKRDAHRAYSVIRAVNRPFVLHFWDILDEDQLEDPPTQWLIRNASHVFCCSEAVKDALPQLTQHASILRFRRESAAHKAQSPAGNSLRIALIGYCSPYKEGLDLLNGALDRLRQCGIAAQVCFIGGQKQLDQWGHCLPGKVAATGFLHSDDERDTVLAECHVGFLPGPLNPPDRDLRSRFSIPSRILDYLATGLPCLATVHPHSATAVYMAKLGLTECIVPGSTEQLANRLIALADKYSWERGRALSQEAFGAAQQDWGDLRPWLSLAASKSPQI